MRILLAASAVLSLAGAAHAGDLTITVRNGAGAPVRNAVVTLRQAKAPSGPINFPWPYRISQRNIQFDPFVLIAPVGAKVSFPNLDPMRHHVYSFSKPHPFELKLYGRDETRSVVFEKPGVIAVGCNIHDQMAAYVVVVDTPFAAKTDAAGMAVVEDAPAGTVTLKVWHPNLKGPGNEVSRPLTLSSANTAQVIIVEVRSSAASMHMH